MEYRSKINFVVEGKTDADYLRSYLPEKITECSDFFAGSGQMTLSSLSRSILLENPGFLLVVSDSGVTRDFDNDMAKSQIRASIAKHASTNSFDVFMFSPEHEIIFIQTKDLMKYLCEGLDLNEIMLQTLISSPRTAIDVILKKRKIPKSIFLKDILPKFASSIRKHVQVRKILKILSKHVQD